LEPCCAHAASATSAKTLRDRSKATAKTKTRRINHGGDCRLPKVIELCKIALILLPEPVSLSNMGRPPEVHEGAENETAGTSGDRAWVGSALFICVMAFFSTSHFITFTLFAVPDQTAATTAKSYKCDGCNTAAKSLSKRQIDAGACCPEIVVAQRKPPQTISFACSEIDDRCNCNMHVRIIRSPMFPLEPTLQMPAQGRQVSNTNTCC
jgi:hypothetical protein